MSKISLDRITSSFGFTDAMNAVLQKIEDEFSDKVLYRDNPPGTSNAMSTDLDLGGNDVINVGAINAKEFVVNGLDVNAALEAVEIDIAAATESASTASTQAVLASGYADEAEQWANANEDVQVETGKYSAKHFSAKAEGFAIAAGDARDASIVAQGLSEDARDAAIVAQGLSENARDAAIVAQGLSENARDAAQGFANTADVRATQASESAVVAAQSAQDAQAAQLAAELAEDGAQAAQLEVESAISAIPTKGYNHIINGDFRIWQRSTSQNISGIKSADRWGWTLGPGDAGTLSYQVFPAGQTFGDGTMAAPTYARCAFTGGTDPDGHVVIGQAIEGAWTFSGKVVTISFYARCTSETCGVGVEFTQQFGTGGTPSAEVTALGTKKFTLSPTWTRYTHTVTLPSIIGKTYGTDGNHSTNVNFWLSTGANLAARGSSVGRQINTVEITMIKVEEGPVATPYEIMPGAYELERCMRFYEMTYCTAIGMGQPGTFIGYNTPFRVTKAKTPTIRLQTLEANGVNTPFPDAVSPFGVTIAASSTVTGGIKFVVLLSADAEL